MSEPLRMWVVYARPLDYPDAAYIARLWEVVAGAVLATNEVVIGDSLDAVRAQLPEGLHRLPPSPGDDAVIVESWI